MKLFDLDGPIQKYGSMLFDLMMLMFFWLCITIFSLGLLGGIATVAFYYAVYHSIFDTSGSTIKLFFTIFKKKFVIATTTYLTLIPFLIISCVSVYWVWTGVINIIYLLPLYLFFAIELGFMLTYLFPLVAHTTLGYKSTLKTSFLIAGKHLPTTLLCFIITCVGSVLGISFALGDILFFPYFLVYTPLAILGTTYFITKRILFKYPFFEHLD